MLTEVLSPFPVRTVRLAVPEEPLLIVSVAFTEVVLTNSTDFSVTPEGPLRITCEPGVKFVPVRVKTTSCVLVDSCVAGETDVNVGAPVEIGEVSILATPERTFASFGGGPK